ncbi:hypothetical protein AAFF_G00082540 [Aldrovandia affinis]|uniref:Uncharacterized protein n=1 Tax=Aldrovandia affinis TaxID=143900 RepID=A0AAD7T3J7_9TELE|nr:hypothetical protein AAFF_G00082540 [Aldrovandia affinis]
MHAGQPPVRARTQDSGGPGVRPPESEVVGGPENDYPHRLQERLKVVHDFTCQAQAGSGVRQKRAYNTWCRDQVLYRVRMPGWGQEVVCLTSRSAGPVLTPGTARCRGGR